MTGLVMVVRKDGGSTGGNGKAAKGAKTTEEEQNQLSLVAFLMAALRKSMVACRVERGEDMISTVRNMEIGWPTNVRHITHVTFDRFNGFLGLPVELEVEIPCRVPSASEKNGIGVQNNHQAESSWYPRNFTSVFGVSTESMQCSFDSKWNSVPTILVLMQERLYSQGGLKAEGIFRINPENSQEEHVRHQLNRGIVLDNIDVHCLAGLIKAWFRELPQGVLDGLSPEEVLQCNTEEESVELVRQLKPVEAALLNWVVDLMADVVEEEEANKMNARNIAMVFAPNMTQMSDPLTALMHAVQVMNLLKTLIMKTLREREETTSGGSSPVSSHSSDQRSEEDFDSQQEMDTGCELRGPVSDYDDDHAHYSHSSEDEDENEGEPLSEIEECFLRQLDDHKDVRNRFLEQPVDDKQGECSSPRRFSRLNPESGISFTDSKKEKSSSSTSDAEDSGSNLVAVERKIYTQSWSQECENANDMEIVDKAMDSILPLLSCVSNRCV